MIVELYRGQIPRSWTPSLQRTWTWMASMVTGKQSSSPSPISTKTSAERSRSQYVPDPGGRPFLWFQVSWCQLPESSRRRWNPATSLWDAHRHDTIYGHIMTTSLLIVSPWRALSYVYPRSARANLGWEVTICTDHLQVILTLTAAKNQGISRPPNLDNRGEIPNHIQYNLDVCSNAEKDARNGNFSMAGLCKM